MKTNDIPDILERNYNLNIKGIELFREGGNLAYVVFDRDTKYFLKVVRPPFIENVLRSIDIQLYLMKNRFPVIPIILTKDDTAYVKIGNNNEVRIFILYEYIEGDEPARENTEKVGELIGRLHKVMKDYTGELRTGQHFYRDTWKL